MKAYTAKRINNDQEKIIHISHLFTQIYLQTIFHKKTKICFNQTFEHTISGYNFKAILLIINELTTYLVYHRFRIELEN